MDEVFTVEEAARYLKVSQDTIRRLLRKKRIRALKVGNQWRIRKADLDALYQEPPPPTTKP